MKSVWKYEIDSMYCALDMPAGAQLLSVREQGDNICLWALVDPEASVQKRRFRVLGTGQALPQGESLCFVGMAHLQDAAYVFHVFEVMGQFAFEQARAPV
jgi:hypothetical protein